MTSIQDAAEGQAAKDPAGVIEFHRGRLTEVLPRQLQPAEAAAGWFSAAIAQLRSKPALWTAAKNDISAFMAAMSEAARLGLVPGTEQYYLTVRSGKIQGIVGYQGVVELMFRTDRVAAVICDVVRETDEFHVDHAAREIHHQPGPGCTWFAEQARGKVIGGYAFAVMADGTTSNIVKIGDERIARAIQASAAAEKGPWATDYAAMVRKTALHDLEKWVPTSASDNRPAALAALQPPPVQLNTTAPLALEASSTDAA